MDFCKVCGKLAHRLVNDKRCQKCRKENRKKPERKPKELSVCKRCNSVKKTNLGYCDFCNRIMKKKGLLKCLTCMSFIYKDQMQSKSKCKKCYHREYAKKNRSRFNERSNKRRADKLNATPDWLTKIDRIIIQDIYDRCPVGHHVDHIVPLQGKTVCGLHVPWNLRIISDKENLSKGNRWWPDMW